MTYYIKNIWGPDGQEGYPRKDKTEFAEGQERAAQRFIKCDGFFLYETGRKNKGKKGAKAVFAQGTVQTPSEVTTNQAEINKKESVEKIFLYEVKINLSVRINPLDGVSLDIIRRVLKKPRENMQRQGGLIKITEDQFNKLCLELERCSKKAKNKK